jgi:hypothetical protein
MTKRRRTTLSPIEEGITLALVTWLESAIIGTTAEDLEIVSGADTGEPADPFIAVFVSVAGGRQGIARAFEITLAIMAEDSAWLPDDADDMMDEVHGVLSLPIDPKAEAEEPGEQPFSAILAELADMQSDAAVPSFFKIQSLTEALEPRLSNHAENHERRIYRGTVIL